MSLKIFQDRGRFKGLVAAVSITTALAVTGFLGLHAATVNRGENPPATVKTTTVGPSHAGGYAGVVKQVVPAVVYITSTKVVKQNPNFQLPDDFFRQFFGDNVPQQFNGNGRGFNLRQAPQQEEREQGLGSGVIVSPEGYILTNNHVVDGATDIMVTLHDKRQLKGRVVGTDAKTDIAVVKVDGSNFPTLTLADSSKLEVGDIVLAVGQPFGLGETVTQGIVSAKGRSGLGIEQLEDFIQTDAAINPGNSGGALVDDEGHLVGINTAIVGGQGGNVGIGFAVPINMAKHDMDEILAHGKVSRAYMGIYPEDLSPALARSFHVQNMTGALVSNISDDSPASHSNLKTGDVIVEINGQPVKDANDLRLKIGNMSPGTNVTFKVMRNGTPMNVSMTLGETPTEQAQNTLQRGQRNSGGSAEALQGVTVENLTPDVARQLQIPSATLGVVVDSVSASSKAAEANLQQGDVIVQVNHRPVANTQEFREAVNGTSKDEPILLLVNRNGNTIFLAVS